MGFFKMFDQLWLNCCENLSDSAQAGFVRLLALANTILDMGRFSIQEKVPYTKEQVQGAAKISPETWDELGKNDMIWKDENGFFAIKNWKKYQNEYQRQKGYRKKLQVKVTPKGTGEEVRSKKEEVISKTKELKTTTSPSAQSEMRAFTDCWYELMKKETGDHGKFNGRDGKAASEILKRVSLERAKEVIQWAVTVGLKDKYLAGRCDRLFKVDENWSLIISKMPQQKATSGKKYKNEVANV